MIKHFSEIDFKQPNYLLIDKINEIIDEINRIQPRKK